jgi:DNA-binding NarL/FixJ family response regulator
MEHVRTLIVDDEEDMRLLLRTTIKLANRGLEVLGEATDGVEALEAWRAEDPDCIVIDHRMPRKSGMEVCEEILREQPEQRIVLFSAFVDDAMRSKARRLGVRACLDKNEVHRLPEILWSLDVA